jgi:uncharacterized protein YjiS (DUF1127 family)
MTAIDTSRAMASKGLFARLNTLANNFFGSVASWNDARVTRNALEQLTDRELADIGLCRGDIEYVATRG